jgi:hypothetical protein
VDIQRELRAFEVPEGPERQNLSFFVHVVDEDDLGSLLGSVADVCVGCSDKGAFVGAEVGAGVVEADLPHRNESVIEPRDRVLAAMAESIRI